MKYAVAAVSVLLAIYVLSTYRTNPSPKLNVVLISIDSLRADHMSLYGYARNTTPTIDAFAKSASVFTNFFSTSYLTPISEASVQTGEDPFTNGVINFGSYFSENTQTLAQMLQVNGWETGAFGSSPEFQYFPVLHSDFEKGFDVYAINSDLSLPWLGRGMLGTSNEINWMQTQIDSQKPFFMWLTVGSVHWPYAENEPHHFSDPSYNGPLADSKSDETDNYIGSQFNKKYGTVFNGSIYGPNQNVLIQDASVDIKYVNDRYDDGLVMTDRQLKPVLDFLSKPGIAEHTIVIIESEHGEELGEHGYIAHYDVLDSQTHVPFVLKIPGWTPKRLTGLASGVDILPTILDTLHLPVPATVTGTSLLPYVSGITPKSPNNEVFLARTPLWERVIYTSALALHPLAKEDAQSPNYDVAIRTEKWKLIHRLARVVEQQYSWYGLLTGTTLPLRDEYELYDEQTDPGEQHNVYATYENDPDITALRAKLATSEEKDSQLLPTSHQELEIQPYF